MLQRDVRCSMCTCTCTCIALFVWYNMGPLINFWRYIHVHVHVHPSANKFCCVCAISLSLSLSLLSLLPPPSLPVSLFHPPTHSQTNRDFGSRDKQGTYACQFVGVCVCVLLRLVANLPHPGANISMVPRQTITECMCYGVDSCSIQSQNRLANQEHRVIVQQYS